MHLRSSLLFYLFLLAANVAIGQQQQLDSLRLVISSSAPDPEKIKASLSLSSAILLKDFDECLSISATGAALAQKVNDQASFSEFQKTIGLSYYFKGNFDSAAAYYYRALDILNKINAPDKKAAVLNELGKLYRKIKDLDRSLKIYDEAYAL